MFSLIKEGGGGDLKGGLLPLLVGGGLVAVGYHLGKRFARFESWPLSVQCIITFNPILCLKL